MPNILFAGDRLQSIYNPKEINWRTNAGLDMRGRSRLLKTSYRTTSEHISLALNLLETEKEYATEVEKFYEGKTGIVGKKDIKNSIEFTTDIVNKVVELLQMHKHNKILILVASKYKAEELMRQLPVKIRPYLLFQKEIIGDSKTTITTYHSSKGLEAKVVIILNINDIEDKKLAYVAMTRASEKLIIHAFNLNKGLAKEMQDIKIHETKLYNILKVYFEMLKKI